MIDTTNQQVLTLYAALIAKSGKGASVNMDNVQALTDWVNNNAKSVESGLAALQIVLTTCASGMTVKDIISKATAYDNFIYVPDTTTPAVAPAIASVEVKTTK